MQTRVCTKCKKTLSVEKFSWKIKAKKRRSPVCKDCHNAYKRERYACVGSSRKRTKENVNKRKKELRKRMYTYLSTQECVDCGERDPAVLEFDHVRGVKFQPISTMISNGYGWSAVMEEIRKCDVRCANCHRRKTAKDQHWYEGYID